MKQTEVTYQVFENFDVVATKLLNLGYQRKENFLLEDSYYTSLPKTKIMSASYADLIKNSTLIRHIIFPNGKRVLKLCYKDKSFDQNGNVLGEQKFETNIDNIQGATEILGNLGFSNWCYSFANLYVFEKNKKEIVLQDVKNLGVLLEVEEFEEMKNLSPEEKINSLKKFVKTLKLDVGEDYNCKKAYMILHQKDI